MNIISRLIGLLFLSYCSISLAASNPQITSYTDVGYGPAIVFIHAFPTDQRLWLPQQYAFKKHHRVITLDLNGFGRAEPTDGSTITMSAYADEIQELLTRLKIKKATIVGESMGGYIALELLHRHPDTVAGLVLSDTQAIADSTEMKEKREATAIDVLQHGTAELVSDFMPKALSPKASEDTVDYLRAIVNEQPATAIATALRGIALRTDSSDVLANTTVPVLIITGDQDAIISPQQSSNMHNLARNSHLVVLKNAGHLSSLEQPKHWNTAVKEWIKGSLL